MIGGFYIKNYTIKPNQTIYFFNKSFKNITPVSQEINLDDRDYNLHTTTYNEKEIINQQPIAILKRRHIKEVKYINERNFKNITTGKTIKLDIDLDYIIGMRQTNTITSNERNKYGKFTLDCFEEEMAISDNKSHRYFSIKVKKHKSNDEYEDAGSLIAYEGLDIILIEKEKKLKPLSNELNVYIANVCTSLKYRGFGLMKILIQYMVDYYKQNDKFNRLTLNGVKSAAKYYEKFGFTYQTKNNIRLETDYGYLMELNL